MNSTPRDAQAPRHRECLLPSVARTPSVTKVTPAKKITFLKRGDPQFAGVRLAVHQRAFKTFSALMDELSQRVPLSFGVRSVTTPRGLHSLSALEQLEDGGCYFCSDKKPPKTPSGPGRPQGRSPTAQQLRDIEGRREAPGTSSSRKSLKTPRRILLVKNMDPRLQQTVVLSHRNTRNLTAFLSKASDLLRFPVKQLYTTSGKKVDSLQALLHSPSVLVCAGHEAFRPPAMENARRSEAETLSGLTSRNKTVSCWGPKTKPSVIHSRSRPGSRPQLPERPVPSNPPVGPAPDRHPQDTPAQPGPLVAGDDMKKKVRMNEDGSLSVEMKVRFHLVGEDTLLWSRRMGRASALTAASGEDPILGEVDPLCCVWEGYPWGFSDPGVWGPRPCRVGCGEAFGRGGQPGPKYEIWTNPLHASQGERVATRKRWGLAQHVRCSGLWGHRAAGRERCSQDSASPASSTGHPEGSEPDSSCCPRTPEDGVDSGSPSAQRRAEGEAGGSLGEDPSLCTDGAGLGSPEQGGCLTPRARSEEGASSDSLASTGSHEGSSEWGGRPRGCPGKARAETSQQEAIKGGNPGSSAPSLSSLRSEDLQAEMQGRSTEQAGGASVKRGRLVPGLSGSWDSEGASSTPSTSASSQQEQRRHRSRASATSSPSSPGLGRVAPRGHPRQCRYCKDTHNPLDSSVTKQVPRPPERRRACRDGSVKRSSGSSLSTRTQASGNLRPPSLGSLPSQDLLGISSATVTHAGHSDCASGVSPYNAPSVGWAGDAGSRTCSLDPTPPHTSDSCSKSGAASLGEQARDTPQPSSPLVLQVGWPEQGAAGPHQSCCHSQAGTEPAEEAQWGPSPEAHWLCGRYCPTPPRGRPCPQRRSSSCGSTGSSHRSAARGPGGSQQKEGTHQAVPTLSLGPGSGASRRSSASQDVGSGGLSQEETSRSWGGPQGQEEASSVSPSSLPRSSPEAVVREWLDNIPEEPVLMTYEMADETTGAARGGLRGPEVDPGDDHSLEGLGEPALAGQQRLEGDPGQDPEPEGALPGTSDAGPQSGEGVPQGAAPEGVSEAPAEARADREDPASCRVSLRALPGQVSASTQIMRALMGSKQGRPSSMPEVSRPMARRLSRSAGALITCLASLQFFDEDLGSPASKVRFKDSPRYQELLSISKDLWPGCDLGEDQLDSGLWELTWSQALPDPGSHAVTENFTPTSSSGVDISSGSGGSGESSVPCAMDGTLVSEGTELPLKTSNQRPDPRTSENPGDLENQQQCCSPAFLNSQACACATNEDEAERDSEEQRASSNLEQLAENTMQEEEVQLEERLQEEGLQLEGTLKQKGPQEEGVSVGRQGSSPGKMTQCRRRKRERSLCRAAAPEGSRGTAPGAASHLRETQPRAPRESKWRPQLEPGLEKPPGAANDGPPEHTQAKPRRGRAERELFVALRSGSGLATRILVFRCWLKRPEKPLGPADKMTCWTRWRPRLQAGVARRLQEAPRESCRSPGPGGRMGPGPAQGGPSNLGSCSCKTPAAQTAGLRALPQPSSAFSERTLGLGPFSFYAGESASAQVQPWGASGRGREGEEFCPSLRPPKPTNGGNRVPQKRALLNCSRFCRGRGKNSTDGEASGVAACTGLVRVSRRRAQGQGWVCGWSGPGEDGGGKPRDIDRDKDPKPWGRQGGDGEAQKREGEEPHSENPVWARAGGREETGGQGSGHGTELAEGEAQPESEGVEAQEAEGEAQPESEGVEALEAEGEAQPESEGVEAPEAEGEAQPEAEGVEAQEAEGEAQPEAEGVEALEAEGEAQPESEGETQGEKKGSPQVSLGDGQSGGASESSSPAPEDRPTPPPSPGGDTPHQKPTFQTGPSSSRACSQGSSWRKDSEDSHVCGDTRSPDAKSMGAPHADRKATRMYPESSTSEQEEAPSDTRTPEQGAREGCDPQEDQTLGNPAPTKAVGRADGFGQDDLDF
uniref:Retinitis pigmentosa 1-like 1 protein n=1 Tax=Rhinopithecus bieti TaxID=61621 RepID=A0A2K6MIU3_RHIBE